MPGSTPCLLLEVDPGLRLKLAPQLLGGVELAPGEEEQLAGCHPHVKLRKRERPAETGMST